MRVTTLKRVTIITAAAMVVAVNAGNSTSSNSHSNSNEEGSGPGPAMLLFVAPLACFVGAGLNVCCKRIGLELIDFCTARRGLGDVSQGQNPDGAVVEDNIVREDNKVGSV
jgi:hypothetical protein